MSYRIYTTDCFIIKTRVSRDADASLLLFTNQFGLLNANARSLRQGKSKLRYSLQSLSFSSISLVKGRELWRVTSAKKHISLYDKRLPLVYRTMFARMLMFIERFCPRETSEPEIFEIMKQISGFIFKREAVRSKLEQKKVDSEKPASNIAGPKVEVAGIFIERLEMIFMLKSLFELGYVSQESDTEINSNIIKKEISEEMIGSLADEAIFKKIKQMIEKGMNESHL